MKHVLKKKNPAAPARDDAWSNKYEIITRQRHHRRRRSMMDEAGRGGAGKPTGKEAGSPL